jgi:hypothetical protein
LITDIRIVVGNQRVRAVHPKFLRGITDVGGFVRGFHAFSPQSPVSVPRRHPRGTDNKREESNPTNCLKNNDFTFICYIIIYKVI